MNIRRQDFLSDKFLATIAAGFAALIICNGRGLNAFSISFKLSFILFLKLTGVVIHYDLLFRKPTVRAIQFIHIQSSAENDLLLVIPIGFVVFRRPSNVHVTRPYPLPIIGSHAVVRRVAIASRRN